MKMGIRLRKLKPKLAKSVKRHAIKKQAWDDGYRYGFNCYKPSFIYSDKKLDAEFTKGFYAGLSAK
tara:strand:- start:40 stop:237 length:198 start_codon:yes stop_codon:yes gene_type:complete